MKTFVRLTIALAMLIPVGALSAGPAGAAGGTTCKGASGKISLKPGLTTKPAVQTISINLPITGCVGGGVTGGTFKGVLKTTPISISTIATSTAPLKFASTVTWNTKATSSLTASSTTKIVKGVINSSVKGKISKGLFVGLTLSSSQTVKVGPLVGGKIVSLTITAKGALTIK